MLFLLLGYPVAFSLAFTGLVWGFVGIALHVFPVSLFQALPDRIYVANNDTLLAVPFFTFMGIVLERSGMAEELLDTIGQLSARSAAGSPTPSSSSARCWPRPPAWWPPRSSRWD